MAFQNIVDYFQELAQANIAIDGSFIYGPTERIIGDQRADIQYPVLYLELPDFSIRDNGASNITNEFVLGFSILDKSDGSYASENIKWDSTDEIMQDFLARIWRDRTKLQWLQTLNNFTITPVFAKMADQMIGWRCEFVRVENVAFLLDPDKWNDLNP